MTRPRSQLVSISDTPYYHVVSRCVRRSYLCGIDPRTGENYEHRRLWIEQRIRLLSSLFSIQICAYSVMSNHIHLVVKLCPNELDLLSNADILERWTSLFKGPYLIQRYQAGDALNQAQRDTVSDILAVYRQRLGSLSWFMKCLNEPLARLANKEDHCTGHFWEARFRSQALLSEEALLSCMAYVDLNPVRAKMAPTPEESDYTSIKERIRPVFDLAAALDEQFDEQNLLRFEMGLRPLAQFKDECGTDYNTRFDTSFDTNKGTDNAQASIPFSFKDYLELVDYTGRIIRPGKRGAIAATLPPILQRLGINPKRWHTNSTDFESIYNKHFAKRRSKRPSAQAG